MVAEPFTLAPGGTMGVPTSAGLGVTVDLDYVDAVTVEREVVAP